MRDRPVPRSTGRCLGERLPYADGEFDLVVCALAIHYAEDRGAAFREFSRVLGGAVVFSTHHPTTDWLRKGMRNRWPEHWEKLNRRPGFVLMRLVKPGTHPVL